MEQNLGANILPIGSQKATVETVDGEAQLVIWNTTDQGPMKEFRPIMHIRLDDASMTELIGTACLAQAKRRAAADPAQEQAAAAAKRKDLLERLTPYLVEGRTLITHTVCGGSMVEHIYTGMDGSWLCGFPTSETMRLQVGAPTSGEANDISVMNITHLDRIPVDQLDYLSPPTASASSSEHVLDALPYVTGGRSRANDDQVPF